MAGQMNAKLGIDLPWWVWVLIAWALVLGLSIISVDIGAKLLGTLMILEVLALFLVAVAVLAQGGGPDGMDFAASFSPTEIFAGGFAGSAGIALAFAFASYIGFEATAIYGEETRDPKRSVPIATYIAVLLIAGLFALTSFAVVSGLGSDAIVDRVAEVSAVDGEPLVAPEAVLFAVAEEYVGGWLADLMGWLVLSSLFAGLLAFQNSAARYFFSMGRAGALPTGARQGERAWRAGSGCHRDLGPHPDRDPAVRGLRQGPGAEHVLLVQRRRRARDRLRRDPGVARGDRLLPQGALGHAGVEHPHRAGVSRWSVWRSGPTCWPPASGCWPGRRPRASTRPPRPGACRLWAGSS